MTSVWRASSGSAAALTMRKYHRWLSVIFGVFLLWISVTGIASHVSELIANGGFEAEEPGTKPALGRRWR